MSDLTRTAPPAVTPPAGPHVSRREKIDTLLRGFARLSDADQEKLIEAGFVIVRALESGAGGAR